MIVINYIFFFYIPDHSLIRGARRFISTKYFCQTRSEYWLIWFIIEWKIYNLKFDFNERVRKILSAHVWRQCFACRSLHPLRMYFVGWSSIRFNLRSHLQIFIPNHRWRIPCASVTQPCQHFSFDYVHWRKKRIWYLLLFFSREEQPLKKGAFPRE